MVQAALLIFVATIAAFNAAAEKSPPHIAASDCSLLEVENAFESGGWYFFESCTLNGARTVSDLPASAMPLTLVLQNVTWSGGTFAFSAGGRSAENIHIEIRNSSLTGLECALCLNRIQALRNLTVFVNTSTIRADEGVVSLHASSTTVTVTGIHLTAEHSTFGVSEADGGGGLMALTVGAVHTLRNISLACLGCDIVVTGGSGGSVMALQTRASSEINGVLEGLRITLHSSDASVTIRREGVTARGVRAV